MEQKPSVGRMVLFHEEGGPYPSIVTALNENGTLELVTFGKNSVYFQHGVPEHPPEGPTPRHCWSWPPRI